MRRAVGSVLSSRSSVLGDSTRCAEIRLRKQWLVPRKYDQIMKARFNNCIAIGVENKQLAAKSFVELFGAEIKRTTDEYVEVAAGPYMFYFVEDGTKDIAFSVDCEDPDEVVAEVAQKGFTLDQPKTDLCNEPFVVSPDGILINVFKVGKVDKQP